MFSMWPLRRKYRPRGWTKDQIIQQGHGRMHGGNNYRVTRRHKLTDQEKRTGLFGYFVYQPPMYRLRAGKLRQVREA